MATKKPLCNYSGAIEELHSGDDLGVAGSGLTTAIDFQKFTASGTWNKPSGAKLTEVIAWGGGSGGSSGRRGQTTTNRGGGGGGAAGACVIERYDPSLLASSVSVTIGAAGTGGTAQTSDNA